MGLKSSKKASKKGSRKGSTSSESAKKPSGLKKLINMCTGKSNKAPKAENIEEQKDPQTSLPSSPKK
jgi:hypothetical protein